MPEAGVKRCSRIHWAALCLFVRICQLESLFYYRVIISNHNAAQTDNCLTYLSKKSSSLRMINLPGVLRRRMAPLIFPADLTLYSGIIELCSPRRWIKLSASHHHNSGKSSTSIAWSCFQVVFKALY